MADILTTSASDLENGVVVQASADGTYVSIVAVNYKARKDRVTELTITLPNNAGASHAYYLVDAGHSDLYDSSPDDGTLQSITFPTVTAGTVTLQMQPRSVHLLQFIETVTFDQLLNVTITVNPTVVKSVGKNVTQTVTANPTLTRAIFRAANLLVTVTANSTIVRNVGKILSLSVTATPSIAKRMAKTISVTVTATPSIVAHFTVVFVKALTVTVTASPFFHGCQYLAFNALVRPIIGVVAVVKGALGFTPKTPGNLSVTAGPDNDVTVTPVTSQPLDVDELENC